MVGWSRRNREASERRARWWATLSDEEKAEYNRRAAEQDERFFAFCRVFFPVMIGTLLLIVALHALAGSR
jgi:hypothetical protein